MKKLIVANWKMNLSDAQAYTWLSTELPSVLETMSSTEHSLAICPSYTVLPYATIQYPKSTYSQLSWGAQDCGFKEKGAYTGDISVLSLKDLKVDYCLIGHSERRRYYGETDTRVAQKAELLLNNDIHPIICIGETAEEIPQRDRVLVCQLELVLPLYKGTQPLIAYEPVWAIGTGKVPSIDEISKAVNSIKRLCSSLEPTILYGGSVDDSPAMKDFGSLVDGFLIGTASLDGQLLKKIILSC